MNSFKDYIDRSWGYDGLSAKCLYGVYIGNKVSNNYPHDPDDLCRILQMLRLIPIERRNELLRECADFYDSKEWRTLYHNWNKLMDIFSKEWDKKSAPKTYKFMNQIYQECRKR